MKRNCKTGLLLISFILILLFSMLFSGCEKKVRIFTLTYSADPKEGGTIEGDTSFTLQAGEKSGVVTAKACEGYEFSKWSDGYKNPKRGNDSVSEDTTIYAIFTAIPHTLTYKPDTIYGGKVTGTTEQKLITGDKSTEVTAIPNAGYVFAGWSDGVTSNTRSGDSITEDTTISANFRYPDIKINVADMNIKTYDGKPILYKTLYKDCTIEISGAENEEYNGTFQSQIHGRGNSSWSSTPNQDLYDSKNSYSVKLNEKAKLLGVGDSKNRDWILIANKFDGSALRNWSVWRLGQLFDNIAYSTESTWVQLYVNGEYRGLYTLAEKIEAASDRIEIVDEGDEVDKGYVIQLNKRAQGKEGWDYFFVDGFYGDESKTDKRPFELMSDITSEAQVEFIKSYFQKCHDAIMTGNRDAIDKLIDIPSMIDMFIIEELGKDVDVNFASFYMYKDKGGKLCFTSPWDFDFGMGTYGAANSIYDLITDSNSGNVWYKALVKTDWFNAEVIKRMKEVEPLFYKMTEELLVTGKALTGAADKNDEKWNIYGEHYHKYVDSQVSDALADYKAHYEFLYFWYIDRWGILQDTLNGEY